MILKKYIGVISLVLLGLLACKNDDDIGDITIPVNDIGEQAAADDLLLQAYLKTHFYNAEDFDTPPEGFDGFIKFDTISGANSAKTPLIDLVEPKTVTFGDVAHTLYVLKPKLGAGAVAATLVDSVLVSYQGTAIYAMADSDIDGIPDVYDIDSDTNKDNEEIIDTDKDGIIDTADADVNADGVIEEGKLDSNDNGIDDRVEGSAFFDSAVTPVWFDLLGVVDGFANGIQGFRGSETSGLNADGTIGFGDDFGIGAVFMPSRLGYFNQVQTNIPAYSSLVFSFKVFDVQMADHDNDGVVSRAEGLDDNGDLEARDTDADGIPDLNDIDDDNDGTATIDEIERTDTNGDGVIDENDDYSYPDSDADSIPDYLDADTN